MGQGQAFSRIKTHRPRIVLLGKTGQLGSYLAQKLPNYGECFSLGRAECDLSNPENLRPLLRSLKPDIIVNAAAFAAVDQAETQPDLSFALNAYLPQVLGEEAEVLGALVIHYSTDYVFDGKKGAPYVETDEPNPLNIYGESKLAGEIALQKATQRVVIGRISWLMSPAPQNFAAAVLRKAYKGEPIAAFEDQQSIPTPCGLAADMAIRSIQKFWEEPGLLSFGLYHVTPKEYCSRYEQACFLLSEAQKRGVPLLLNPLEIKSVSLASLSLPACRPLFSVLSSGKYEKEFHLNLPSWKLATQEVMAELLDALYLP